MKTTISQRKSSQAFTLIEMIGVLAVIAILASMLIPKIFDAINSARINNAAVSCNTVKTALADHYSKFGNLPSSNGVALVVTDIGAQQFDKTLVQEGFLDKLFAVKISSVAAGAALTNHVEIVTALAAGTPATINNAAYALGGVATVNDATGSVVVQAVIPGVSETDAKDLNDRLDGPTLGSPLATDDTLGRVKYDAVTPTTVYVYLTHR